jgi:hypothetical protein
MSRPLDIYGQFDGKRFSAAFGVQPDHRAYYVRTRRFKSGTAYTFVQFWAFVLILAKHDEVAA